MRRVFREVPERPVFPEFDNKNSIMKNIITVAALLAAGTAFANAESESTLLWTTSFQNANNKSLSNLPWSDILVNNPGAEGISGGLSGSVTAASGDKVSNFNYWLTGLPNNESFFSPGVNVGSGNDWNATFSYSGDGLASVYSFDAITLNVGLFTSSGAWQSGSTTRFFDFSLTLKDGNGNVVGTFSNSNVSITGNGDNTRASVELTAADSVRWITAQNSPLVAELTVSQGSSNNNLGCFIGLNSIAYSGSVVPEPSAFGLLAGAGALALVAARRRRRRA